MSGADDCNVGYAIDTPQPFSALQHAVGVATATQLADLLCEHQS